MICANCTRQTPEDDYLCVICRSQDEKSIPIPLGEVLESPHHAFLVGEILALLVHEKQRDPNWIEVQPQMQDGDYTHVIEVQRPDGWYTVTVEKL